MLVLDLPFKPNGCYQEIAEKGRLEGERLFSITPLTMRSGPLLHEITAKLEQAVVG